MKPDLKLLTIEQLHILTGRDTRTITKALKGLKPARVTSRSRLYEAAKALEWLYLGQERLSITDESARLAKARADAQELKNKQELGELVPAESLDASLISLATVVSTRLQGLGARHAPALAAEEGVAQCREIVDEGVNEALAGLVDASEEAQKRLDTPRPKEAPPSSD